MRSGHMKAKVVANWRWNVELDLRNLKTTTGMDVLRCQTPQMNDKQLWVHLLAYNVIRLHMAQAASNADVDPRNLSFKHIVHLWTQWVACGLSATHDSGRLFALIAQHKWVIGGGASSLECEKENPNLTLGSRRPGLALARRFSDTGTPGPQSKCRST